MFKGGRLERLGLLGEWGSRLGEGEGDGEGAITKVPIKAADKDTLNEVVHSKFRDGVHQEKDEEGNSKIDYLDSHSFCSLVISTSRTDQ